MEGNVQQQKTTPLARELTRIFNSYHKHTMQLKKNLKETNAFFREIRQNYSNACASTMSSDSASLEAGGSEHMQQQTSQHLCGAPKLLIHVWSTPQTTCHTSVSCSETKKKEVVFCCQTDFSTNTQTERNALIRGKLKRLSPPLKSTRKLSAPSMLRFLHSLAGWEPGTPFLYFALIVPCVCQ